MHLIRSGHENIAILCGSEDREFNRERIEGYKRALRDNQILIRKIKEAYKSNNSKAKSASKATGKQGDTEKPSKPEIFPLCALMIFPGQP